jgi:hypothetical protein
MVQVRPRQVKVGAASPTSQSTFIGAADAEKAASRSSADIHATAPKLLTQGFPRFTFSQRPMILSAMVCPLSSFCYANKKKRLQGYQQGFMSFTAMKSLPCNLNAIKQKL